MSKKIAIVQSNYIPWKGYFDMIAAVDEFILYDDVQFTKNDWRNRNKIKTPKGVEWISIPVGQGINRRIRDVELLDHRWQEKHWKSLAQNYRRSPHFAEIAAWLETLYLGQLYTHLSQVNRAFIEAICNYLGVRTRITNSWDYTLLDGKTERLADLCAKTGGSEYISGPAAMDYIDKSVFEGMGIKLTWFDYTDYPEYPQSWGPFEHGVSIMDLLFNCGKDSYQFMRYVRA
ncbi:MAG: WbqC family protein [Pseudomonadota bacterium]|nr:WbqC family protein [Pseudomonadota bacterium]MDP1903381.1 WbqC family protein [Pseudomonadota bacterium]MDP2352351.1 WbqC family protein [Pseudomonadota bacterium]